MKLTITHNAGFFSNCNMRLDAVVQFFNQHKRLPDEVDSSQQFEWYRTQPNDITCDYFKTKESHITFQKEIDYQNEKQFTDFSTLDFEQINPFIQKYFSPSDKILEIIKSLEQKYAIDYENLCAVLYRGTDKIREMQLPSYDSYHQKMQQLNCKFLLQSDETEFLEHMHKNMPNSITFYDEIRHIPKNSVKSVDLNDSRIPKCQENYQFSLNYLAITYIMSRCKYVICSYGNCSLFVALFRGNTTNLWQID